MISNRHSSPHSTRHPLWSRILSTVLFTLYLCPLFATAQLNSQPTQAHTDHEARVVILNFEAPRDLSSLKVKLVSSIARVSALEYRGPQKFSLLNYEEAVDENGVKIEDCDVRCKLTWAESVGIDYVITGKLTPTRDALYQVRLWIHRVEGRSLLESVEFQGEINPTLPLNKAISKLLAMVNSSHRGIVYSVNQDRVTDDERETQAEEVRAPLRGFYLRVQAGLQGATHIRKTKMSRTYDFDGSVGYLHENWGIELGIGNSLSEHAYRVSDIEKVPEYSWLKFEGVIYYPIIFEETVISLGGGFGARELKRYISTSYKESSLFTLSGGNDFVRRDQAVSLLLRPTIIISSHFLVAIDYDLSFIEGIPAMGSFGFNFGFLIH